MTDFVVDSSVTMAWAFDDEDDDYANQVLGSLETTAALASPVWPLEVANVLVVAERKGRIGIADSQRFIRLLEALPIEVHPVSVGECLQAVLDAARRHGLSAYDASYLQLAMDRSLPLATNDLPLRRAAEAAGVSIWSPEG